MKHDHVDEVDQQRPSGSFITSAVWPRAVPLLFTLSDFLLFFSLTFQKLAFPHPQQ
jgi:hypothetical protein